jgi:hypothetical protein
MLTFAAVPAPWGLIGQLLLLAAALLLVGGFALNAYEPTRLGRMPKRTQLPQSFLLIVVALIVWIAAVRTTPLSTLGLLAAFGIACGFLGDLFMANVFDQQDHVLYGMVAFAIGHLFYMLGFREIALAFDLHALGSYALALVVMWGVAVTIWFLMVRSPTGDRTMQIAALVYALFLASMAAYALGLALQESAFWPLAIGGVLFLISDALIAARLFGGRRFAYMGDVIWATYIIAQVLIVTAVPVALAL